MFIFIIKFKSYSEGDNAEAREIFVASSSLYLDAFVRQAVGDVCVVLEFEMHLTNHLIQMQSRVVRSESLSGEMANDFREALRIDNKCFCALYKVIFIV